MPEDAEGGSAAPQRQPTTTRCEARARADSQTETKSVVACTDDEVAATQSPIPRSRSKQRRSNKDCALPGAAPPVVSLSNFLAVEVNLRGWNAEIENVSMLQGLSFAPIRLVITEDVIALGGGGYFSDKIPLCDVDAYQAVIDKKV